jgi:hypothetical protein
MGAGGSNSFSTRQIIRTNLITMWAVKHILRGIEECHRLTQGCVSPKLSKN